MLRRCAINDRLMLLVKCVVYYKSNVTNLGLHLPIFIHCFLRKLYIAGIVKQICSVLGGHDISTSGIIPVSTSIYLFFCKLLIP